TLFSQCRSRPPRPECQNSLVRRHLRRSLSFPGQTPATARRLLPPPVLSFTQPSARPSDPCRADVVHYFSLRTTMAPNPTKQLKIEGRPVWAEISKSALTQNLRAIRDFVNPSGEK